MHGQERSAGTELGPRRGAGAAVGRADLLADVASEDPVTHQWAQLARDDAAMFDREVRDAAVAVDDVGSDYSAGRAGAQTEVTAAAIGAQRLILGQLQLGQDLAQEDPRAGLLGDDVGVLADPADAGPPRR